MLPSLLGLGQGDVVVHPRIAYPTYDVGARLAGATALPADDVADWADPPGVRLVWLNTPSNPTGAVLDVAALAEAVAAARRIGAVVASDECYALLPWTSPGSRGVPSVLDPRVTGGSHEGCSRLLLVQAVQPRRYRAAFAAGDPDLVAGLLAGPQAHRHDGAGSRAGRDGAGARRRRARARAAREVRPSSCGPSCGLPRGGVRGRPVAGRALPVGARAGSGRLGDGGGPRRPGDPRGARFVLRRGGRRARPRGTHRHR